MQIEGKLTKWNDDRGFGFITPNLGGQEIFVHVSAFPRDGRRPQIGEPLSFEIETNADGRKRAVTVQRPASAAGRTAAAPARSYDEKMPHSPRRRPFGRVVPVVVVIAISVAGYGEFERRTNAHTLVSDPAPTSARIRSETAESPFRCDGRKKCNQMTSCAEATFFLRHCPGVEMDGDGDGIPCEDQLCGH